MKCANINLRSIIDGREDTVAYSQALAHLENCPSCQRELDCVYSTDVCTCEVSSVLKQASSDATIADSWETWADEEDWEIDLTNCDPTQPSPEIELLQPAIHPELLGRLGRYDVERVVGVGGMATVYKAYDTELRRVVALKVLTSHLARFANGRQRFAREARAAAAILHPNVLPIYNVEANGRSPYLVMQYVPGCSLQTRVEKSGPLPIEQVLRIASQTAAALAAAHQQGLVHRDVKPSNILLEDKTDRVVLSDFGLARTADDAAITHTGIVAGTPRYMSPEQATGETIDHRSDLFSLGSVIYFMLTGQTPFNGNNVVSILHRICKYPHEPLQKHRPDLHPDVISLVDQLLTKDLEQRPNTALEVETKLEQLLSLWHRGKLERKRRRSYSPRPWKDLLLVCGKMSIAFVAWTTLLNWYSGEDALWVPVNRYAKNASKNITGYTGQPSTTPRLERPAVATQSAPITPAWSPAPLASFDPPSSSTTSPASTAPTPQTTYHQPISIPPSKPPIAVTAYEAIHSIFIDPDLEIVIARQQMLKDMAKALDRMELPNSALERLSTISGLTESHDMQSLLSDIQILESSIKQSLLSPPEN